jgi:hypothetical protein
MAGIGSSPFKPRIVEGKLTMACTIVYTENKYSMKNLGINGLFSYQVPLHSEMVGAHLLGRRLATGMVEHFL